MTLKQTSLIILLSALLSACAPAATPTAQPQTGITPTPTILVTEERPTPTNVPLPPEPSPAAEGTPTALAPLPPEPQQVDFETEDGTLLAGTYYPAATNPAPVVVLMHWARGDQKDWAAIAPWLQNRGVTADTAAEGTPWLDASWFPPMPADRAYAVFTFTFRGCEGSCSDFNQEGWLNDARAAMRTVQGLPGVDPMRVVAIGASIGSDGAADACEEGCLGSFSISPGGYLTIAYADAVSALEGKPAWCLAAEGDGKSAETCRAASGAAYTMQIYPGGDHGMQLLQPSTEPNVLQLMLDFLAATL